ncbi:MAG TPA: hypothetical protein VMP08_03555 [Anaerolineae bacterium]|nr:hypothetical protein [Anaerolineae bacterium]
MSDFNQEVIQLLTELDQPAMSSTAYDTAWLARVPGEAHWTQRAFPEALEWLRCHQHADGSWGSQLVHYHDRVICTLNALIALAEYGIESADRAAIRRGETYLHHAALHLACDAHDTVGFELIVPTLLEQARQLNLHIPYAQLDRYQAIREEKLRLIPRSLIYSRQVTTAHSLEFMGDDLEFRRIDQLQEANGSLGHSPSATAYLVHKRPFNTAARQYLVEVSQLAAGAAMPAHPVEIFDTSWALYNLELAQYYASLNGPLTARLRSLLQAWDMCAGLGFSHDYSVPDLDDTAVVFKLLARAGLALDPTVFQAYERDTHFVCYQFERNPSVGAHIHLLEALDTCAPTPEVTRMTIKALNFLRRSRVNDAYWFDKWHISPYYITSHAIIATLCLDQGLARDAMTWMLGTQNKDGSWGFCQPTAEETAYCLQALLAYHNEVKPIELAVLDRAAEYVYRHYQDAEYPAMWIEKALYTPEHIVTSALISALSMYEATRATQVR